MALGVRDLTLNPYSVSSLCHPLASYSNSLSLGFHICQMGITVVSTSVGCRVHYARVAVSPVEGLRLPSLVTAQKASRDCCRPKTPARVLFTALHLCPFHPMSGLSSAEMALQVILTRNKISSGKSAEGWPLEHSLHCICALGLDPRITATLSSLTGLSGPLEGPPAALQVFSSS